ncbi:MAG TPA: serine/threonine-protein kinase [Steroidobacteraceae bacterium]|nr:serine/threonine-protein kinase [Steroidobacteraceae bacterium]
MTNDGAPVDGGRYRPRNPGFADPPPRIEAGRVLRDRYVIEQRLGNSGKGTVFKALDRYRTGLQGAPRYVAIKVLDELAGTRDESIEALRHELQSAQMLSHPNIVRVYDLDRDGDLVFFTMEYLEGELLSSLIQRFQPLAMSRPDAWSIIRQIASGLEHAHGRNMVHGDLKPQNIMITNSGEVRILGFGASRTLPGPNHAAPAGRAAPSGALAYACCEMLDGRNPDPRDDLYSLACLSYELLAGAHPFQRRRANEARDFAIVATRPSGLRRRQWHTLAKGLSWHRAGRSIPVGEWFKRLKPGEGPAPRVASIGDLKPAPIESHHPLAPLRASALFSILISTAAVCMLFVRMSPDGKVSGEALPPSSANASRSNATHSIPGPSAIAGSSSLPAMGPGAASLLQSHSDDAVNTGLKPASPLSRNGAITLSPGDLQVPPGEHFAEIRVHRPANAHSDARLVWWTEAASAKPGIDYISQAKVTQAFPKGKDSMSFFVKLLPKSTRTQDEVFYVAVAGKDDKRPLRITHTAVHLPSTRTTS